MRLKGGAGALALGLVLAALVFVSGGAASKLVVRPPTATNLRSALLANLGPALFEGTAGFATSIRATGTYDVQMVRTSAAKAGFVHAGLEGPFSSHPDMPVYVVVMRVHFTTNCSESFPERGCGVGSVLELGYEASYLDLGWVHRWRSYPDLKRLGVPVSLKRQASPPASVRAALLATARAFTREYEHGKDEQPRNVRAVLTTWSGIGLLVGEPQTSVPWHDAGQPVYAIAMEGSFEHPKCRNLYACPRKVGPVLVVEVGFGTGTDSYPSAKVLPRYPDLASLGRTVLLSG